MPWVPVPFTFAQHDTKPLAHLVFIGMRRPVPYDANELRGIRSIEDRVDCCAQSFCEAFCFAQIKHITNKLLIGAFFERLLGVSQVVE